MIACSGDNFFNPLIDGIECRGFLFYYKEVPTTDNIGANKLKKTKLLQKHQQGGNNSMPEENEWISLK